MSDPVPQPEPKPQKKRSRYPGTRKKGSTWMYVLELGRDPVTQKRRQQWVSKDPKTGVTFRTQREAFAARCEAQTKLRSGTYVEPSQQTVEEYLNYWLEQMAPHWKRHSERTFRQAVELHIVPRLGSIRLDLLRPVHVQELVTVLINRGFADGTVRQYVTVLRSAMRQAVRWQIIGSNPCENVVLPEAPPADARSEGLTAAELKTLLAHLSGHPMQVPILLGTLAAMREGEVVGLRWSDVDLETGIITVRHQLQSLPGGGWELTDAKCKKGKKPKIVPFKMPAHLHTALIRHKGKQTEARLLIPREERHDYDFVVAHPNGLPYTGTYIARTYRKMAIELGLSVIRFHGLRHTHSSQLLAEGVPLPTVSKRLRHSSPIVTARIYAYVQPDQQERATAALDGLLGDG